VFSAPRLIDYVTRLQLHRLLDLARRTLESDGLFIAETINPPIRGLKTHCLDVTPRHRIFQAAA
jgi:hypothetical protein